MHMQVSVSSSHAEANTIMEQEKAQPFMALQVTSFHRITPKLFIPIQEMPFMC